MANRMLRTAIGSGLLAALAGCNLDGTPAVKFADDPLPKVLPYVLTGAAPAISRDNALAGATAYNVGNEMGRQQAAINGRSVQSVNVNARPSTPGSQDDSSKDPDFGIALKELNELTPRQIDKLYRDFGVPPRNSETFEHSKRYLADRWYLFSEDQKKIIRRYMPQDSLPKD